MQLIHASGWGRWRARDGKSVEIIFGLGVGDPMCGPLRNWDYSARGIIVTKNDNEVTCVDCLAWLAKFTRESD